MLLDDTINYLCSSGKIKYTVSVRRYNWNLSKTMNNHIKKIDIYKFLNSMIFLLVNHNLLYTILGTYPPGPFRNDQNSPKKNSIFPAFPATLFQRGNFQHAKFFQRRKFAGKANCSSNHWATKATEFLHTN